MTGERDFDRLAQAWLELGPDEAPDRVVAAVLQAAQTTPQARRPIRWLRLRDDKMTRLPVLATVAATIVVVIGGLLFINRPNGGVGAPTASPSPSAPSSASPAAAPLNVAIRSTRWMGSERPVPGILPKAGTIINFTADNQFFITQSNENEAHFLNSVASSVGDGQFRLETTTSDGPCSTGDIGRYGWSVNPTTRILTIVANGDDCATRLGAVPGTWWLEACKNDQTNCLGDLDAGTYKSQYFTPRLDAGAGAAWVPDFGALRYTVPDGWANSVDFPERFSLTPSADFALEGKVGPDAVHKIELHWQYAASAQNAECKSAELTSVPRTVDGLIAWIRGLASLDAGAPSAITIDGQPGQWLDVSMASSWTTLCPGATQPIAVILTEAGSSAAADTYAIGQTDRVRMVFLDLGGGDLLMVEIITSDAARFDSLVAQAMPIIGSFIFE